MSRSTPSTARTRPSPRPYSLRRARACTESCSSSITPSVIAPAAGPVPLAGLQPAQVSLEPEHNALQQQGSIGISRLTHGRVLRVTQPAQQFAALGTDDADRIGQPGRCGSDELEMKFRQVRLRPAQFRQPLGHPLLPSRSEGVELTVGTVRRGARLFNHHKPGSLQSAEGDIDVARVQSLPERAKGVIEPGSQLIRVRGFLGEQRQRRFLFAPGEWGSIVNGGAWLTVSRARVDLIYRDLDEVLRWTAAAGEGRFEIHREVGYAAGIATYILAGELALGKVLAGELPRPAFPPRLRETAPAARLRWQPGRCRSRTSTRGGRTGWRAWPTCARRCWPPPRADSRPRASGCSTRSGLPNGPGSTPSRTGSRNPGRTWARSSPTSAPASS